MRQAVSLAINRPAIVTDLMKGAASVGTQLYGKGNAGYDPTLSVQDPYDPAKARQLLAQAGYPNGFSTKMPCSPAGTGIPSTDLIMEQVQSDLAKLGVKVQLQMTEWNSYLAVWLKGIPRGQGIGAECMSIGTDDAYILNMYASDHNEPPVGWNINWYSNAQVDTLLKQAAEHPAPASTSPSNGRPRRSSSRNAGTSSSSTTPGPTPSRSGSTAGSRLAPG